jgi:ribonuclease BN (tRNA processing enzyme)
MGARRDLDLTFLGAGNAFGNDRCYSGFVANGRVLLDAPPTAVLSLKRARLPMEQIDTIILSHFHADHFFGIPFILLEYTFPGAAGGRTPNRTRDLTIVGPPGVGDTVERVNELAFPKLLNRNPSYKRHYVEMEPGREAEVQGLRLSAARMNHASDSLDLCLGYRLEIDGHMLAYTGDSAWCDSLIEIGRGAEVYVTDCNYPSGRNVPEHLSLDEVRDLRAMLDPRTRMVLTHLGHDEAPRDMPNTRVASDLARFVFK